MPQWSFYILFCCTKTWTANTFTSCSCFSHTCLLHLLPLSLSPPTVGHGQSEGERMNIKDFQFYVRDSLQHIDLMKSRHPELPVFILGHSMVPHRHRFFALGVLQDAKPFSFFFLFPKKVKKSALCDVISGFKIPFWDHLLATCVLILFLLRKVQQIVFCKQTFLEI